MTTTEQQQYSIDPKVFASDAAQSVGWVAQSYDRFTVGDRVRRVEHLPDGILRITEGVVVRIDGDRLYSQGGMLLASKRDTMLEYGDENASTFTKGQAGWKQFNDDRELLDDVKGVARTVHTSFDGTKQMHSSVVLTATKEAVRNEYGATIVAIRQMRRPGIWLEYKPHSVNA